MNEREKLEHEAIKNMLKMTVLNNDSFTIQQKQQAMNNIDQAAKKADWITWMLRMCGYIN